MREAVDTKKEMPSVAKAAMRMAAKTRRGDTIIEVMFSVAIFALVAVITITMMNAGLAGAERSLEIVTARYEMNVQAETLRFIYNSYMSELSLPTCDSSVIVNAGPNDDKKCQQFKGLWESIKSRANVANDFTMPASINNCSEIYKDDLLHKNNAFILNARRIGNLANDKLNDILVPYHADKFVPATLGARTLYTKNIAGIGETTGDIMTTPSDYTTFARAEGIWVTAMQGDGFYDFYIQSCWYGSGNRAPTTLDTIIRLYNPGV